jgi:hypothetical protein
MSAPADTISPDYCSLPSVNMLTGQARPDSWAISVGGIDCAGRPRAAQHLIGVGGRAEGRI